MSNGTEVKGWMALEAKFGLVVAGSVLCLVAVVVFFKYRHSPSVVPEGNETPIEMTEPEPLAQDEPSPSIVPIQPIQQPVVAEVAGELQPVLSEPTPQTVPPALFPEELAQNQPAVVQAAAQVLEPPAPANLQPDGAGLALGGFSPPPAPASEPVADTLVPPAPPVVSNDKPPTAPVEMPIAASAVAVEPAPAPPVPAGVSDPLIPQGTAPVEPVPVMPETQPAPVAPSAPPAAILAPVRAGDRTQSPAVRGPAPVIPSSIPPMTGSKPVEPVSPTPAPSPRAPARPAIPAPPRVESFDEEEYRLKAGDTFESISTHFYRTPKYAAALALFNRNHPLAPIGMRQDQPVLQPGQPVFIPPTRILEKRHGASIPDLPPLSPTGTPNVERSSNAPPNTGTQSAGNKQYRVAGNGEMFRSIALRTLKNGDRWNDIYRLNRQYDPARPIPTGTVLILPPDAEVEPAIQP
jgi:hypothetical protein